MSKDNNVIEENTSLAILNKNILDIFKQQYSQLAQIDCINNFLIYNNESFPLGYYRLNQLPIMIWEMPANEFYKIVKILAQLENNLSKEEEYLFNINELLTKSYLNDQEKIIINNFMEQYLTLLKYEDYLFENSSLTLSKYRQIVHYIKYLCDQNNLTVGQKIIYEKIAENENIGGRENSLNRVLTNPNFPNMAPDDTGYSKAGFASIILVLYSLINAAIILAIHLIK